MAKNLKGEGLSESYVREKPHIRFDEGELEKQLTAVCLLPTLHGRRIR